MIDLIIYNCDCHFLVSFNDIWSFTSCLRKPLLNQVDNWHARRYLQQLNEQFWCIKTQRICPFCLNNESRHPIPSYSERIQYFRQSKPQYPRPLQRTTAFNAFENQPIHRNVYLKIPYSRLKMIDILLWCWNGTSFLKTIEIQECSIRAGLGIDQWSHKRFL